jgi:hypothetical protein
LPGIPPNIPSSSLAPPPDVSPNMQGPITRSRSHSGSPQPPTLRKSGQKPRSRSASSGGGKNTT